MADRQPAPEGLLIELSTFESAYRPYEVYFLNSTQTKVVPDVRWYAAPPDSLATLLVTALEHGPSKWLEGACRNRADRESRSRPISCRSATG